jgi:hypothetical protein
MILGVLFYNGWNVFDPFMVSQQYPVPDGGKVDIALIIYGNPTVFIEIKKPDKALNKKDIEQLTRYMNQRQEINMGVLTNAIDWIFLTPSGQILTEVNINKYTNDQIKEAFNEYLSFGKACQQYINNKKVENLSRFEIEYFLSHKILNKEQIDQILQKNLDKLNNTEIDSEKCTAISNLQALNDKRSIKALEKAAKDKNKMVSKQAQNCLLNIKNI